MAHKGKRLKAAEATLDRAKLYPLGDAVRLTRGGQIVNQRLLGA